MSKKQYVVVAGVLLSIVTISPVSLNLQSLKKIVGTYKQDFGIALGGAAFVALASYFIYNLESGSSTNQAPEHHQWISTADDKIWAPVVKLAKQLEVRTESAKHVVGVQKNQKTAIERVADYVEQRIDLKRANKYLEHHLMDDLDAVLN